VPTGRARSSLAVWQKQSPHDNAKEAHLLSVVFFLPKPCPPIRHGLQVAYIGKWEGMGNKKADLRTGQPL